MKTLYEILEVSENASKEIIEKAYRVLAKKYHPDLQEEGNKTDAEKKMKEINEAYSILSDDTKRKQYNDKLELERKAEEEKKSQISYEQNNSTQYYEKSTQTQAQANRQKPMTEEEYIQAMKKKEQDIMQRQNMQRQMEQEMQAEYQQKYQEAYEDYLRSLGYRIKYKWTWKNYRDLLITILIIIAICTILWFFPPTHKLIIDFYNSNPIIKTIIDVIGGVLKGIWNAICSIFK